MAEGSGSVIVRLLHLKGLLLSPRSSDVVVTCKTQTAYGPHRARAVVSKRTSYEQHPALTIGIEGAELLKITVADLLTFGRESVVATAIVDLEQLGLSLGCTRTLSLPLSPQGEMKVWVRLVGSRPLFGVDLKVICHNEGTAVPRIVTKCIQAVEGSGLNIEGIYRVPGSQPAIDALKTGFQESEGIFNFSKEHLRNINNIASLLKQFLNALPRPLLSSQTERMLQAFRESPPAELKRTLFDLFMAIANPYRATALALLNHMLKIAAHADKNQMTHANLATCFGPSLIAPSQSAGRGPVSVQEMQSIAKQSKDCNTFISFVLEQPDLIRACVERDPSWIDRSNPSSPHSSSTSSLSSDKPQTQQRPLDVFQQHQPVDIQAFRLVCHELGWYVSPEEKRIFTAAAGGNDTMVWPQFKRWWEESDRRQLSPLKMHALRQAARFFRFYADADGSVRGDRAAEMLGDLRQAHPDLEMNGTDELLHFTFHGYISFLIRRNIL